jgi:hypothetical protein
LLFNKFQNKKNAPLAKPNGFVGPPPPLPAKNMRFYAASILFFAGTACKMVIKSND